MNTQSYVIGETTGLIDYSGSPDYHLNAIKYIRESKNYYFAQNILTNLVCNCCAEHQINKPIIFKKFVETGIPNQDKRKTCLCRCRQLSREICRQCPSEPDVITPKKQKMNPTNPPQLIRKRKIFH